jgi:hypothetical protein
VVCLTFTLCLIGFPILAIADTTTEITFEVPLGPYCLSETDGAYPLSVTNITNTWNGLFYSTLNLSGYVIGDAQFGAVMLPATGRFKVSSSGVRLSLKATAGDNSLKLSGSGALGIITGKSTGKGAIAPGKGTFELDLTKVSPMVADVDVEITVDDQGKVTGTGTATTCNTQVVLSVTGTAKDKLSLKLAGGGLSWTGKGVITGTNYVINWKAKGAGSSTSGTGMAIPFFGVAGGGGGGGGGKKITSAFDGTYYCTVTSWAPGMPTQSGPAMFTVTGGFAADPGYAFTGFVYSDGSFVGFDNAGAGVTFNMTGWFYKNGTVNISGGDSAAGMSITVP